jgi:heme-degrading monooxygenase HmoA
MKNKIHNSNNPQQITSQHNSRRGLLRLVEMDEKVRFLEQMEQDVAPVILINKFSMKEEDVDKFLRAWAASAAIMKRQPGIISAQLHRGIGGSSVFLNYAVCESTEHFKKAFNNPEFQSSLEKYPSSVVASPHLFKKVAVPGIVEMNNNNK